MLGEWSLQGASFGEIRSFSLAFLASGAQIRCKQFSFLFLASSLVILIVLEL